MSSTVDNDYYEIKKQVMIAHFSNIAGCTTEQALQMLQSARWNYEVRVCDHACSAFECFS